MITYNADGTIGFSLFTQFPTLLCRLSTKNGDISLDSYSMEQVHGSKIHIIDEKEAKLIKQVDGLISLEPGTYLSVRVADCVPIFFYNPTQKLTAVVHAGWKGTRDLITATMTTQLQTLDSDMHHWYAAIGPHIGACCYTVPEERAHLFQDEFCDTSGWHVDLGLANRRQLLDAGMYQDHIDAPVSCTSCQNDRYYSFRREGARAGRMIGVIGVVQ